MFFGTPLDTIKEKNIKVLLQEIINLIEPMKPFLTETTQNTKKYFYSHPHGSSGSLPPDNLSKVKSRYSPEYYAFDIIAGNISSIESLEMYLDLLKEAKRLRKKRTIKDIQIKNLILIIRRFYTNEIDLIKKIESKPATIRAICYNENGSKVFDSNMKFAREYRIPAFLELRRILNAINELFKTN